MSTPTPTVIVIIGGGGDLTQRKLMPALFNLYKEGRLPNEICIIGLARTERTVAEYQSLIAEALHKHVKNYDDKEIDDFCSLLLYVSGSYEELQSYRSLENVIAEFENKSAARSNRLFYLAVPPTNYKTIFETLSLSSLAKNIEDRWSRILVEKPFGHNYETAVGLEHVLSQNFAEEQIFRIDHYLAKEAVMNILSFRFANTILHSSWNKEHIKEVRIILHESSNADTRGAFYDAVGALRDVGQNHILQILALIAMDAPKELSASHIRQARQNILECLIPIQQSTVQEQVVRAQYENFAHTPGVTKDSDTETYVEFVAYLEHPNWSNVPFYISAGKAVSRDEVSVEVVFHDVATGPFVSQSTEENKVILTISPVQSMNVTLNVKEPGHEFALEASTLSFEWNENQEMGYTAYEKILLDCLQGDQTLFTKTEEVLASWKFITSILDAWGNIPLQTYLQGSQGPKHSLLKRV